MNQNISRREAAIMMTGLLGMVFARSLVAGNQQIASGATPRITAPASGAMLVVVSLHHQNTLTLAHAMAPVLGASIVAPHETSISELMGQDLIGFGSGIYDQKHHPAIERLVDALPENADKKVFIFSTSGVSRKTCLKHNMDEPHTVIRNKLLLKGCTIVDEFNCVGWNTNSFLKLFGGINRSRPNDDDCRGVQKFAERMLG